MGAHIVTARESIAGGVETVKFSHVWCAILYANDLFGEESVAWPSEL
jgi:hypothetical protein